MQNQISPKTVALTFGILILIFVIGFYISAWTEPTTAPPAGNVTTPINVGGTTQYKSGALGIGGVLDVVGGLRMTIGAGAGKVLTSDSSGIASWQTAGGGGGTITTYKMTVSAYCVGSYYCSAKTIPYTCPGGAIVTDITCSSIIVDGEQYCDCSGGTTPTAILKHFVVQAQSTVWGVQRHPADWCETYGNIACYKPGSSCSMSFRCGSESTVGTPSSETCTTRAIWDGSTALCDPVVEESYCDSQCKGAGWDDGELSSCSPNLLVCQTYSQIMSGCGWGPITVINIPGCSNSGHTVSCHCWNN